MKKLVIPTILAATILVAGMFAFMPIQKVSTVHSALQSSVRDTVQLVGVGASVLGGGPAIVLVDNAGIGGTVNAEINWRIADADCVIKTVTGVTLSAALTDDGALDGLFGAATNHRDVTAVDAIVVTGGAATPANDCAFAAGDYVTVNVVKAT